MDEAQRLQYLDAMGITVWRLRDAFAPAAGDVASPISTDAGDAASAAELPGSAAAPAGVGRAPHTEARPLTASVPLTPPTDRPVAVRAPNTQPAAVQPASNRTVPAPPPPTVERPSPLSATDSAPPFDEPPPWSDDDVAGLPFDDVGQLPADLFHDEAQPGPPPNPVASMDWPALKEAVAGCRACRLCERRTNTVFGVGNEQAELMFVGEGPGQDEDRKGEPFVGRAGQLFNRMLAAVDLTREQVYIANIVKCRPPGNRDPQTAEIDTCTPYLRRQIDIIRPKSILALGRFAGSWLSGQSDSLARMRGRTFDFRGVPVVVTYHPSGVLRNPEYRRPVWDDLRRLRELYAGADTAGGAGPDTGEA